SRRCSSGRSGAPSSCHGGGREERRRLAGKRTRIGKLVFSGDSDIRLRRSWSCWKAGDTRILLGPIREILDGVWPVNSARRSWTFLALFRPFRRHSGIGPFI